MSRGPYPLRPDLKHEQFVCQVHSAKTLHDDHEKNNYCFTSNCQAFCSFLCSFLRCCFYTTIKRKIVLDNRWKELVISDCENKALRHLFVGTEENHEPPVVVAGILPDAKPSLFRVANLDRHLQKSVTNTFCWCQIVFEISAKDPDMKSDLKKIRWRWMY
jgi:hypothetical protein